jgi:hypothetical protein
MFSTFESKLPNTNTIFCMKQVEMVRKRQRTYGSKNRMFTRGRECKVQGTSRSLCRPIRNSMQQAERMCGSKSRTFSLLSCEGWYATAENMRFFEPHVLFFEPHVLFFEPHVLFFEPHVLFAVSREPVCERQRMCGSKNHAFSIMFCGR